MLGMTLSKDMFVTQTRLLMRLGLPIVLGQLAQMSMSVVDTIVAGRASSVDMSGVAIGGAFWIPTLLFGQGLINPIGPLVAQGSGAGTKDLDNFWRQGLWLALHISIFLTFLLYFFSQFILVKEGIEVEVAQISSLYLQFIMWGLPPFLGFFACRYFLEGQGFTRPAMIAGFIGLACNIPLNYIFVFGYFGMPKLGGAGCGLASAFVCWIMFFVMICFVKKNFPNVLFFVKPSYKFILRIVRIGMPGAFAMTLEVSAFTLIALFIAPLKSVVISGHHAAMNVSSFSFMLPLSLGIAASIRTGACLGAKKLSEAIAVRQTSMLIALALGIVLFFTLLAIRSPIAHVYSIDPAVIALASYILIFTALYQIPDCLQIIFIATLRGYNDTKAIFIIALVCYWLLCIPVGYVLCFGPDIFDAQSIWGQFFHALFDVFGLKALGVQGFWIGIILGLSVACVLFYQRIRSLESRSPEFIAAKIAR